MEIKLNDSLQRVQVGRYKEVPIETSSQLWFLWVDNEGDWDAEAITRPENILNSLTQIKDVNNLVFCIWHGAHRTNLFLMDIDNLIERLIKIVHQKRTNHQQSNR